MNFNCFCDAVYKAQLIGERSVHQTDFRAREAFRNTKFNLINTQLNRRTAFLEFLKFVLPIRLGLFAGYWASSDMLVLSLIAYHDEACRETASLKPGENDCRPVSECV